ncbi:MAG TPA: phosphoribosylglycinamide formyltransferase [Parvularculaceae bacterium]|nr:phosphoribosylglycinamide formyltransferase [Parvularculaceae bacterium]
MARKKLAVLISGRGSNLQSLLDAAAAKDFPAEIALVISNKPDAGGLARAEKAGVPQLTINHRDFGKGPAARAAFDGALSDALAKADIDFICLAGFMRILTEEFVERWRGKLINIHPSLLPSFKGLDVHERMIEAGVKIAGCTVHFVTAEMDAGPIIGQAAVPVMPGDDADTLAARILTEEHRLYPACVKLLAEGKARLTAKGVVEFDSDVGAGAPLLNPAP